MLCPEDGDGKTLGTKVSTKKLAIINVPKELVSQPILDGEHRRNDNITSPSDRTVFIDVERHRAVFESEQSNLNDRLHTLKMEKVFEGRRADKGK